MRSHCYRGPENFRVKLALSLLSMKSLKLVNIRSKSLQPGVTNAEVSLLKLIDEISNGTHVKINDTGTAVVFKPGILTGGSIEFDCSTDRGLGYYLEFLLLVAPFCKQPLEARLRGVTNCLTDPSAEMIKQAWFPIYRSIIGASAAADLQLEVTKRGVSPNGGGEVLFCTKPCTSIIPITKVSVGKVYRIRGIAWSCRVSSGYGYKVITGAKSILNRFLSDVYITLDHRKDDLAGLSPGFGLTLWAETKNDAVYSAEAMSEPQSSNASPVDAEGIGRTAASRLLNQIYHGGFVDTGAQSLALILMACESGRNASQLAIGPPSSYTVSTLKLVQDLLGVTFHFSYGNRTSAKEPSSPRPLQDNDMTVEQPPVADTVTTKETPEEEDDNGSLSDLLIATCFGAGVKNIGRSIR